MLNELKNNMWKIMNVDRYAELQKMLGSTVINVNNIWWRKVRPYFFRPLLPFEVYDVEELNEKCSKIAAFQYGEKKVSLCNSYLNLVLFDHLSKYNLSSIKKNNIKKIKKAINNNLVVKKISNINDFTEHGYNVYMSFYNRTKYRYLNKRTDKEKFTKWARTIFRFPEVDVRGVYYEQKLISFAISMLVGKAVILESTIYSDLALKMHASDLILHRYREQAAKRSDIEFIYSGYFIRNRGINNYKIERGANVVSIPAHLIINKALLWIIKISSRNIYDRIIGFKEYRTQ